MRLIVVAESLTSAPQQSSYISWSKCATDSNFSDHAGGAAEQQHPRDYRRACSTFVRPPFCSDHLRGLTISCSSHKGLSPEVCVHISALGKFFGRSSRGWAELTKLHSDRGIRCHDMLHGGATGDLEERDQRRDVGLLYLPLSYNRHVTVLHRGYHVHIHSSGKSHPPMRLSRSMILTYSTDVRPQAGYRLTSLTL